MNAKEMAMNLAKALEDMKAKDLRIIDIEEISSLGDYFVIATGTSSTHVQALCDKAEVRLKELGEAPLRTEGYRSQGWVLLDYGQVVLHVFTEEARAFYDLDRLWSDGKQLCME